jgi:hypothetical protein
MGWWRVEGGAMILRIDSGEDTISGVWTWVWNGEFMLMQVAWFSDTVFFALDVLSNRIEIVLIVEIASIFRRAAFPRPSEGTGA